MDLEQQENIDRVSERIGWAVREFCEEGCPKDFYADDLRLYVRRRVGEIAPGSADRILRDLRQKGKLSYRIVSRKESLYRILWVGSNKTNGDHN